jgi:hypothetical protein
MKLIAAIVAAAAAALVSAGVLDGPCTIKLQSSEGDSCDAVKDCLAEFKLEKGDKPNSPKLTFANNGSDCINSEVTGVNAEKLATLEYTTGDGFGVTIEGNSTRLSFSAVKSASQCDGTLQVTSGSCLFMSAPTKSSASSTVTSVATVAMVATAAGVAMFL